MTQVANATDVGSLLSALASARAGMQRGLRGLAADAQKIAHGNVERDEPVADLTDALVQSLVDRSQVELSARLMRSADEILGTIVDVKA